MSSDLVTAAFIATFIVQWIIVLCLCVMMVATLRHLSLMFDALDPLIKFRMTASQIKIGDTLPEVSLEKPGHGSVQLHQYSGEFLFLLVVQLGCEPCHALLTGVREELRGQCADGWKTVVIVLGNEAAAAELQRECQLTDDVFVLADKSGGVGAPWGWGVTETPFGLVVDGDGRVQRKLRSVTVAQTREILGSDPSKQIGAGMVRAARELVFMSRHDGHGEAARQGGDRP
jgi:peroxiredoxin